MTDRLREIEDCLDEGDWAPADAEKWLFQALAEIRRLRTENDECRRLLATRVEAQRLSDANDEIRRLRDGTECHEAQPGTGTYECSVDAPCPACRLRVAEAEVARLRESRKIDFTGIKYQYKRNGTPEPNEHLDASYEYLRHAALKQYRKDKP